MPELDEIEGQTKPQDAIPVPAQPPPDPPNSPGEPTDEPFYADQSPLRASKEEHLRASKEGVKGRPRVNEDGMSTSVLRSNETKPFPIPRFRVFKSDSTNMNARSKSFFTYWNQLPQWAKDQSILYVYREWPVFRTLAEDSGEVQYIDKISGGEPLQDDVDLLQRYGAGSYKLMFNEYHSKTAKKFVPGENKTANTVATVYVVNLGIGDLKSNPPTDVRINRVENVDLDQPANKSYVEYLRGRGLLPEQGRKVEKEAEVAVIQLVDKLEQRNADLTNKMLNMAEKSSNDKEPLIETLIEGSRRANEMVQSASDQRVTMLMDTMTKIQDLKEKAAEAIASGGANGSDPTVILTLALELAKQFSGNGRQDQALADEVKELRKRLDDANNARFAALEKQLERNASPSVAPSPFSSVKEGLTAMRAMKEMVEEMSGGKEANPVAEAAAAAGAPAWLMPAITIGLPIIGNIVQAIMSRQQGAPQPFQPVNMPGPGPMQPMPPQSPSNVTVMPAPQAIAAVPQPATGQAGQDHIAPPPKPPLETYGLPMEVALLLHEVKTPLVQYMNGRISGDDFADWFVGGYGDALWKQIADSGAESLAGAILAFPPIMEKLTALNIGPERVKVFAEEFVKWTPEEPEGIQGA